MVYAAKKVQETSAAAAAPLAYLTLVLLGLLRAFAPDPIQVHRRHDAPAHTGLAVRCKQKKVVGFLAA